MAKTIDLNTAHFRIGWEKSLDNTNMGESMARFHCLAVDHNRIDAQGRLNRFREQLFSNTRGKKRKNRKNQKRIICYFSNY